MHVVQLQPLPIPLYHEVHVVPRPAQVEGYIAVHQDGVAVHGQDAVPLLEAAVLGAVALDGAAIGGDPKARRSGVQNQHDEQAGEKVHKGPRHQDNGLLPSGGVAEGPGVVGGRLLVLPLHGAVAAHGKEAKTVKGISFLFLQQGGSHADGELVDLNAEEFGRGKVAELVDGNEQAEHDEG